MDYRKAVAKYGIDACLEAYKLSQQGEGPSTIGVYLGLTTRQADAAINAGLSIEEKLSITQQPTHEDSR